MNGLCKLQDITVTLLVTNSPLFPAVCVQWGSEIHPATVNVQLHQWDLSQGLWLVRKAPPRCWWGIFCEEKSLLLEKLENTQIKIPYSLLSLFYSQAYLVTEVKLSQAWDPKIVLLPQARSLWSWSFFFSHVQNMYLSWMQLGRFGIRDAKRRTTHFPSSSKLIPLEPPFCLFLFDISISKLPKPIPFYESDKEIFMKNADIILTITEKLIWLVI